jgi:hypothetical protein
MCTRETASRSEGHIQSSWMQLLTLPNCQRPVGAAADPADRFRPAIVAHSAPQVVSALVVASRAKSIIGPTRPAVNSPAVVSRRPATRPELRAGPTADGDEGARTPDPLLAKQVLSQLSYIPGWVTRLFKDRMRVPGFEPGTSALSELRSSQLSYTRDFQLQPLPAAPGETKKPNLSVWLLATGRVGRATCLGGQSGEWS